MRNSTKYSTMDTSTYTPTSCANQSYKNSKKVKKNTNTKHYKPQKIRDINSKNQKKKKAKQLARQLFKLSKKIVHIL